jgi:repressor LexA
MSEMKMTAKQKEILEFIMLSKKQRGYAPSMREIGEVVGLASSASVSHQLSQLEKLGAISRDPNRPRTIDVLLEAAIDQNSPEDVAMIPFVGQIAAGTPITAEQNVEDVFSLPRKLVGQGDLFLLKVKGEEEATVKTFKQNDGHTWLLPRNSAYEPILGDHAVILGKVVAVLRTV